MTLRAWLWECESPEWNISDPHARVALMMATKSERISHFLLLDFCPLNWRRGKETRKQFSNFSSPTPTRYLARHSRRETQGQLSSRVSFSFVRKLGNNIWLSSTSRLTFPSMRTKERGGWIILQRNACRHIGEDGEWKRIIIKIITRRRFYQLRWLRTNRCLVC